MMKWIRYSGAMVNFAFNPLYWKVLPWARREDMQEDQSWCWACGFLGFTFRIWIDNGQW